MQLVLSMCSGIGLLDKAFKDVGFCVVSAGDIILGDWHDLRKFHTPKDKFDGYVCGPPCPDFSGLKRVKGTYSFKMLEEFKRVVLEGQPYWALLENVKGVPDLEIEGYYHQRIDINQGWYSDVSRLRHIQFYCKDKIYLNIPRGKMNKINYSCALASDSRSFKDVCYCQGLPSDFDLPSFNMKGKKKAVGNGVPLAIGNVLAKEVLRVTEQVSLKVTDLNKNNVTDPGKYSVTEQVNFKVTDLNKNSVTAQLNNNVTDREDISLINYCSCGCKRPLTGRKKYFDSSCRKRAERKRKKVKD